MPASVICACALFHVDFRRYNNKENTMQKNLSRTLLSAIAVSLAVAQPAFADKPSWAGGGKQNGNEYDDHGKGNKGAKKGGNNADHGDYHGGGDVNINIGAYFGSPQRQAVYDYYGSDIRSGHCPPGLAKKNNGCLPPGQAKKWSKGHPLPSGVTYYPVPTTLIARLGPAPAGYKYVRVASDILLIAIGTSMVVDAITDLGGLM
jgi:Ni/Co efflux regulator RcnB